MAVTEPSGEVHNEAEMLLKQIAEARDRAAELKLPIVAHLLDMACLDVAISGRAAPDELLKANSKH